MGTRNSLSQKIVFEAHPGGGESLPVQHGLDEIRVLGKNPVILANKLRHERCVQVHPHFQTTFVESVRYSGNRVAHNVPFGLEIGRCHGIRKGESAFRLIPGNREESIPFLIKGGQHGIQVHAFRLEDFLAVRAAAAQDTADAAHERLRANAVQEHAVETAILEMVIIDGNDVGGRFRPCRAVEAEALARCEVIVGGNNAGQIHGRHILAYLLGFGENREPEEHLNVVLVQVLPYLPINILVHAPANDDLPDRNQGVDFLDTADNFLCRMIGRIPAAQGYLDNEFSLLRRLLAGNHCQESGQQADQMVQGTIFLHCGRGWRPPGCTGRPGGP